MINLFRNHQLTLCVILFQMMLAACSSRSEQVNTALLQADSLIEQHPDSALRLLERIDYKSLSGDAQAHYGLLLTAAHYKLYQPVDTAFINRSIAYYSTTHQGIQSSPLLGDKRGATLYYKAVVLYDLGKKQEATLLLKQAEEQAEHSGDELLKNKIYDYLSYINFQSGNYELDAVYGHLFLNSSLKLRDTLQIARAYDYLAVNFSRTEKTDSMMQMQDSCLSLINKVDRETRAYILANIADTRIANEDYQQAEQLLLEAIALKPMANEYIMLGRVRKACADTLQARISWERATTFDDKKFSSEGYALLAELYSERGDYKHARSCDSLSAVYAKKNLAESNTAEISNVQHSFDYHTTEKRSSQMVGRLTISALILAILFFACLFYVVRKGKAVSSIANKERVVADTYRRENEAVKDDNRKLLSERQHLLDRTADLDNQLAERNKELKEVQRKNTVQIADLRKQMTVQEKLNETLAEELRKQQQLTNDVSTLPEVIGHGENIWHILEKERLYPHFSTDDMKAVLSYYAYQFPEKYRMMMDHYQKLDPKYQLFLILQDFHFSYSEFALLMNITPSAARNYPIRIRQREKLEK